MLLLSAWKLTVVVLSFLSVAVVATDEEGLQWLAANKLKEGVVELPSGLQYKVLTKGTGVYHPAIGTSCRCHYAGRLLDGTQFDSSYDRGEPSNFAPNQVIKGWTEAMQLMTEGDKWELYIPSELGYGDRGSPPKIPGGAVLVFEMEILEILGNDKVLAIKCDATTKENCNEKEAEYIDKAKEWPGVKLTLEVKRVEKLLADTSSVKADLVEWMKRRHHILKQLAPKEQDEL